MKPCEIKIESGNPEVLGACVTDEGVNFSVMSHYATGCTLLLFDLKPLKSSEYDIVVGGGCSINGFPMGEDFMSCVRKMGDGCSINGFSGHSRTISVDDAFAVVPFPESCRFGDVFSILVKGLDIENIGYGYLMDGPWDPEHGHRFDKTKILIDPYAKLFWHSDFVAGDMDACDSSNEVEGALLNDSCSSNETLAVKRQYLGVIVNGDFDWSGDVHIGRPMNELVIYEMNVGTFNRKTASDAAVDAPRGGSSISSMGTFDSVREKISYLKTLGINAVEFLPIFEYNENGCRFKAPDGTPLKNVWGYDSTGFFAPKASYASACGTEEKLAELKNLVKELHANGMEVILDVVYNHSPEYDQSGDTISYRGLDNRSYYLLSPDGEYVDFTGCHNTLNAGSPFVRRMVLDSLRYWVREFHIDGFRFDLASVFYRGVPELWEGQYGCTLSGNVVPNSIVSDANGFDSSPKSLVQLISDDPELAGVKLIAEPWDAAGMYQLGHFGEECFGGSAGTGSGAGSGSGAGDNGRTDILLHNSGNCSDIQKSLSVSKYASERWSEWNGRYRDALRRFVKGDAGARWDVKESLCASPDLYAAAGRGTAASINFITAHDGFTLMDLVSYNGKHNDANGEGGRDGSNQNFSWNCGFEGVEGDACGCTGAGAVERHLHVPDEVKNLRIRQIKNFITLLMVSRGVPMILAGDEIGRTQRGNNNAWCQENEISWIDWSLLSKDTGSSNSEESSCAGAGSAMIGNYLSDCGKATSSSYSDSCYGNVIFRHFRDMIAFRKAHPILSAANHYAYSNCGVAGYPDLSWHGERAWDENANHCGLTLGMLLSGDGTFIYVAMNFHWEAHTFELPQLPEGYVWRIAVNTYLADSVSYCADKVSHLTNGPLSDNMSDILVGERSVIVLTAEK